MDLCQVCLKYLLRPAGPLPRRLLLLLTFLESVLQFFDCKSLPQFAER